MKSLKINNVDNLVGSGSRAAKPVGRWKMKPLACAVLCAGSATTSVSNAQGDANSLALEEIIVSATRRSQSIVEVPYNISALTAQALKDSGVSGFSDISRMVPGMTYIDQGPVARGQKNNFVLRGLNASAATNNRGNGDESVATVSTYLGETPIFFSMTAKDLARVEVLRGPQGTLYGSGAVGGTIRFIPNNPDLESGFSLEVEGDVSSTDDSDELNYGTDIYINLPVSDSVGLRFAGGYEELGGFIDGLGLVERDANGAASRRPGDDIYGGYVLKSPQEDINDSESVWWRLTGLWEIGEKAELVFRLAHENNKQDSQQWARSGFAGGVIDSSAALVSGNVIDNKGGCPNNGVASDIFGFPILYPCLGEGGNSAYPNGATEYPAAGSNEHLLPLLEPYEEELDLIALELTADLGFATFTSATSYYETKEDTERETTGFLESALAPGSSSLGSAYAYFPRLLIIDDYTNEAEAFTQEFRLTSNWDKPWDFVVGAYYQDLEETSDQESPWPGISEFCESAGVVIPEGGSEASVGCVGYPGFGGANPQLGDLTFTNDSIEELEDIAIFGEITYHLTDDWQVTGGLRWFDQKFVIDVVQTFPFCGSSCGSDSLGTVANGEAVQEVKETIFKFNTSYDLSEDMMVYLTVAEGFRRGGSNSAPQGGVQESSIVAYDPDEAMNLELGIKGTVDDRFQYTATAYRIDWEDFQTGFYTAFGFGSTTNGGDVTSQGIELELIGQVTEEFSFTLGYTYSDAEVDGTVEIVDLVGSGPEPLRIIEDGSPLPSVPENTVTVNMDYRHDVFSGSMLNWNLNGSFRDETQAEFEPVTIASFDMDSFWMWNASVSMDVNDQLTASLFVRNLLDEEGITGGLPPGFASDKSSGFYVARPRTFGLRLSYLFN